MLLPAPGSVNWTYSVTDANLDFLDAGETITLTYTVTITDNNNDTDTDTVTVTITGSNDVPTLTATAVADFRIHRRRSSLSAGSLRLRISILHRPRRQRCHRCQRRAGPRQCRLERRTIDASLASDRSRILHQRGRCCGSRTINWTYSVTDADLNFLAAGETITLTYSRSPSPTTTTTRIQTPSKSPSRAPTMPL